MALSIAPSMAALFVSDFSIAQYFQVATVACLVYDTIITMDKEIKYFWGSPLKPVTVVYFANRYTGILGAVARFRWYTYQPSISLLTNEHRCKFGGWGRVVSDWFTIALIDYILMARVMALYSQNRRLSFWLKVLLALEVVLMMGLLIHITLDEGLIVRNLVGGLTVCGESKNVVGWGIVFWCIPVVYAAILLALALYKATDYWRIFHSLKGFTLVKVVVQDQLVYFFLVISCCFLNVVEFKLRVSNGLLSSLLDTFGCPTFLCILGSRMLFNLKEAGERGYREGTSYEMKSTTAIEFVS